MNEKSKSADSNVGDGRDDLPDQTVPGAAGQRGAGRSLKPDTTLQGQARRSRRGEIRPAETASPETSHPPRRPLPEEP